MRNIIYKLYFRDNPNKVYIGSATNGNYRIKAHITDLLDKKHHNTLLQMDFNKKGIVNFTWEVIESGVKEGLLQRESYYINLYDAYNKGYNMTTITTAMNTVKKSMFKPEDMGEFDYSIINNFMSKYNIKLKLIDCGYIKELNKDRKANFSKGWWSKQEEDRMLKTLTSVFSYSQNYIKAKSKYIIVCSTESCVVDTLQKYNDINSISFIRKRVETFYIKDDKYLISDIIVISELNPFIWI